MRRWFKLCARTVAGSTLMLVVFLWFGQDWLIYHPAAYPKVSLSGHQRCGGQQIELHTSQGRQVAFYLPARSNAKATPEFLWLVFGGNGSLALDYEGYTLTWDNRFGYLFIDYPSYGLCEGHPNPQSIAESIAAAAAQMRHQFGWSEVDMERRTGVFGHSLGCAAALIAADNLKLRSAVLCAPFTTMTEIAQTVVGWPLCYENRHGFDNVSRLRTLAAAGASVRIFHGDRDEVIPVRMGKTLATLYPASIQLKVMPGSHHNEVVMDAQKQIGEAMLELSGLPRS